MVQTSKTQARQTHFPDGVRRQDEPGFATFKVADSVGVRVNLKILLAIAVSLSLWAVIAIILFV